MGRKKSSQWYKRGLFFCASILAFLAIILPSVTAQAADQKAIYFYYGQGCPHCAKVEDFFQRGDFYAKYHIQSREVYFDRQNATEFNQKLDSLKVPITERGVPMVVAGQKYLTGDQPIIDNFVSLADEYLGEGDNTNQAKSESESSSKLNVFVVVGASLVDAVNPCEFAVMILLLTAILASSRSTRRVVLSGLSFTLAIFISYVLMGLGLYTALGTAGATTIITTIVGILAIVLGLLNMKDFFWYGKVTLIEVPRSWRPTMKKLIAKTTSPMGAFVVGFVVSLFLLPCTSGPYIVVLGLLAQDSLNSGAIGYLLLYNLIFITPMLLITLLVAKGVQVEKLEQQRQKHLKNLHLAAGLLLIALGLFVLL